MRPLAPQPILPSVTSPAAHYSKAYPKDVLMEGIDLSGGTLAEANMLRGVISGGRIANADLSDAVFDSPPIPPKP